MDSMLSEESKRLTNIRSFDKDYKNKVKKAQEKCNIGESDDIKWESIKDIFPKKWEYNKVKYNEVKHEGDIMDSSNDLFLKIIDSIEKSNQQLKQDMNESEKRTFESIKLSEERNVKRFEQILSEIKDSENRMDKRLEQVLVQVKESEGRSEKREESIKTEFKSTKGLVIGATASIIGLCITTIISIVIALMSVFSSPTP